MYLIISFNSAVVAGFASARCLIASNSPQILRSERNELVNGTVEIHQPTFDTRDDSYSPVCRAESCGVYVLQRRGPVLLVHCSFESVGIPRWWVPAWFSEQCHCNAWTPRGMIRYKWSVVELFFTDLCVFIEGVIFRIELVHICLSLSVNQIVILLLVVFDQLFGFLEVMVG